MTRISATAAILIGLVLMTSHPVAAQSDQDAQCFPWQEYRNGRCVAKPSQAPPPMPEPSPSPAAIGSCDGGTRSLSGQCVCQVNTHLDISGHCVADAAPSPLPPIVSPPPARKADDNIVCDGGKVAGGQCLCPAGFRAVATTANANGGMCVKTNAENCQGGELTVGGTCLCNGQVIMSGETYLLEYTNGKCVPKRCPVQTQWREGKCVALSAVSPAPEPEPKAKPAPAKETPKEATGDDDDHRPHCGRGMVRTKNGCVAARHKLPTISPPALAAPSPGLAGAPPNLNSQNLSKYYRTYQNQGNSAMPPN
jgi:hypothetical protein